jgi:Benzoyl-CoA reductase/2-hydroxyglutaryl-CoA dehydratase subunit, BcrC/BadD/HgdB
MFTVLEAISQLSKSYHRWPDQSNVVKQWKSEGKKVFGYMCNHIPEELLFAGDVLPVKFLGDSIPVVEANQYHTVFMCYFARTILEMGLQKELSQLDGMIGAYSCEGGCDIFQIIAETANPSYYQFITLPHDNKGDKKEMATEFLVEEFKVVKRSLEEYLGREITAAEMQKAIEVYNETRGLLRQVYDARGNAERPGFTGAEVAEIMNWVVEVPKDEANAKLKELLTEAAKRQLPAVKGPRIHLSGTLFLDTEIFQLIEDLGGMVVSDDLCMGSRYFWDDIKMPENPTADNLILAMANQKLEKVPCSCMCSEKVAEDRLEHIKKLIKKYQVNGVIFAVHKWCDSHAMDRPFMIKMLQDLGIPVLSFEVERTIGDAQARTRIESFLEMIGGNTSVTG